MCGRSPHNNTYGGGWSVDVALKSERIEARVRSEVKEIIERAAAIRGVSVSSFLIEAVQARAYEVIRAYESMQLSAKDSAAFATALLRAEDPNAALQLALARHGQEVEP